jgi:hypothetical protein
MSRPRWMAVTTIGVALAFLAASAVLAQNGPPRDNPPPGEASAAQEPGQPPGPPPGEQKGPGPARPGERGPGGPPHGPRGPHDGAKGQPGHGPHGPGMPGQMPGMMPGGMPGMQGGMPGMAGGMQGGMPGMPGGMPGMPGGPMGKMQPGMMPPGIPRWPHSDWQSMERNDPEMWRFLKEEGELDRRTRELAMEYRGAPEPRREEVKKELTKLVNRHFEVRQERRQLELKRLDTELKRLREQIEHRTKARSDLVNKRVKELLGDREDEGF